MGKPRLAATVEEIVSEVLIDWLPRQRHLAHPLFELEVEIRKRCAGASVSPPSRATISRRWAAHRKEEALRLATLPGSEIPPGHLVARCPMDIVQIDHTLADSMLVDDASRRPIGRPWLSIALDVSTRCVVGVYVGMDRPNAATVALLLTRVVLPKDGWLASLNVSVDWPMQGIPQLLHLDNAAEFKSRALRAGCREYGVELMYRPAGRPYFGGHIERLMRTIMERVHSLPGSTGSSPKGRKTRPRRRHGAPYPPVVPASSFLRVAPDTDLVNPDFTMLAEAYGMAGEQVLRTADFPAAFERARSSGRPALIELRTDPEVVSPRATISSLRRQGARK